MIDEDYLLGLSIIRYLLILLFRVKRKHGHHANSEIDALKFKKIPVYPDLNELIAEMLKWLR